MAENHRVTLPYIGCFGGEPAGTALVNVAPDSAAIYAMTTLPGFRRRGLASALVQAGLEVARAAGGRQVALYASSMGPPI